MTDGSITPQQRELDQEQAVADLDQSIAYREQALSDREQQRLDARQTLVDIERAETPASQFAAHLALEHRQAELTRTQDRRDAYQNQIDDTQGGHDRLQDTLELGQDAFAGQSELAPTSEDIVEAARRRQQSAVERAQAAVERADAAARRADAALRRTRLMPPAG